MQARTSPWTADFSSTTERHEGIARPSCRPRRTAWCRGRSFEQVSSSERTGNQEGDRHREALVRRSKVGQRDQRRPSSFTTCVEGSRTSARSAQPAENQRAAASRKSRRKTSGTLINVRALNQISPTSSLPS